MGLHGESCSLPSSGQVPGLLGEGRSSAGAEGPLRPGLAACPMRPRGDECRVRSVERQELRARAGPGKTGKTPAGQGRVEAAATRESRRGSRRGTKA